MSTTLLQQGVALVIQQGVSINGAAKQLGIPISTLRLAVVTNPDYVKAKAEGKLRPPPKTEGRDLENLRQHPAVLAVVEGGGTFEMVGEKFDVSPSTLNRWVRAAYPDYGKDRPGYRRSLDVVAEPFLDVLLNYVRDTALQLNTTPDKVCKLMEKRLAQTS